MRCGDGCSDWWSGSGPPHGQVLVYHDLLGMLPGKSPKFVRRYAQIYDEQVEAIGRWSADVRDRTFPSDDETYL